LRSELIELIDKSADESIAPPTPSSPKATNPEIASIYTDGACSNNPGAGGWGVVINFRDHTVKELGGGKANTTNNQMELQAAIAALEFAQQYPASAKQPIDLYTDSKYVIDGITSWIKSWKRNGWQTKTKQPIKNQELWQTLDSLNSARVNWRWVKGHSGDAHNDRCDQIARAFATGQNPNLKNRI
jgi:ribonuclease HI